MVRLLLIPVILVASFLLVANTDGQDKKDKKKAASITGVVVSVDEDDKAKGTGSITVKTPEKKKKDVVIAEAKEHKIAVSKDTKISKAAAKKDEKATDAAFGDLAKDQTVTVTHTDGKAETISIAPPKKKKT